MNPIANNWDSLSKKLTINDKTGCWEWTGYVIPSGYAYVSINMKKTYLHRYSYIVHKGNIPNGLFVLHHCDNKRCCNPEHLFLGTQADNMDDMISKGRGATGDKNSSRKHPEKLQGERNGASKLTELQVNEIKSILKIGISCRQISLRYKVCPTTIMNIKNGNTWKCMMGVGA